MGELIETPTRPPELLDLGPLQRVKLAKEIATELREVIETNKLYTVISGRQYVTVDGWQTVGMLCGCTAREVSCEQDETGTWQAVVELVRCDTGEIIGRGSAILGQDEKTWASRDRFAQRSMCITRATGKAFRLAFGWIIHLSGYETTPAEEMPAEPAPARKPKKTSTPQTNVGRKQAAAVVKAEAAIEEAFATQSMEQMDTIPDRLKTALEQGRLTQTQFDDLGKLYAERRKALEELQPVEDAPW